MTRDDDLDFVKGQVEGLNTICVTLLAILIRTGNPTLKDVVCHSLDTIAAELPGMLISKQEGADFAEGKQDIINRFTQYVKHLNPS